MVGLAASELCGGPMLERLFARLSNFATTVASLTLLLIFLRYFEVTADLPVLLALLVFSLLVALLFDNLATLEADRNQRRGK